MLNKLNFLLLLIKVIIIPLYTLASFHTRSSLQCFFLISGNNFRISKISLPSFSISIYNIILYICHRLDCFSGSSFSMCSFPSYLPYPSVITFSQLVASYFTRIFCQISHSQFSCLLDCFSAFLFQFFSFHSFFPLLPNFRTISQYSALPLKCSPSQILLQFQSFLPIPSFTPLICYSFPGGWFFLLSFFLASGSAR